MQKFWLSLLIGFAITGALALGAQVSQLPHVLSLFRSPGEWLAGTALLKSQFGMSMTDKVAFCGNVLFYSIMAYLLITIIERPKV